MIDISIITSLYRSESHLPSYINHVLNVAQNLDLGLEVVIVANDSTYKEKQLLDKFAETAKLTISMIHCDRESLYASWNRGISQAQANILGIWNVDDIRNIHGLKTGYELLSGAFDIVDFAFRFVKNDISEHTAQYDPNDLSPKTTLSPFWMFHRDLYMSAGPFNENFRLVGDYEWSKRTIVRNANFTKSDVIAGDFVNHGTNLTGTQNPLEWVEYNVALIWHGGEKHIRPVDPKLMREVWEAWGYLEGTISPKQSEWLWGEGAQERYEAYTHERNQPQWIRRLRLALARRNLLKSVEWNIHNKKHD